MKALIVKLIVASGLLNLVSLVEREEVDVPASECIHSAGCSSISQSTNGFPFSYFSEQTHVSSTTGFSNWTSGDLPSFAANWLFWAVVAIVGFLILRWVWDKFSRMVFYFVIIAAGLVYLGSIGVW